MEIDIEKYLKKTSLFNCLNGFQIARLGRAIAIKSHKKGALIFSEGDPASGFYIVAEGKVKVYKLSAQGKEYIMNVFSSGQTIAEVTVFSGQDYPAYAQAITNSTLLFLPKLQLLDILREHPEIALRMLAALSQRQRHFAEMIEDLSLRDVSCRLAKYLLNLSSQKKSNTFSLDMQKSELALKLATIPETLSRNLKKLKNKKLISFKADKITILNPESLRQLAENL